MAKPGETMSLPGFPQPAKGRGQFFVGLVYPGLEAPWDAAVALRIGEKKIAPDVVTRASRISTRYGSMRLPDRARSS